MERRKPNWKKVDFFPIIARIIESESHPNNRFVQRNRIAARLSRDPEARKLVNTRMLESNAGNTVDWFSAYYTGHKNGYKHFLGWGSLLDRFERTEFQGQAAYKVISVDSIELFPDEVQGGVVLREGAVRRVLVNAYERDPTARKICIAKYGSNCSTCNISFGEKYGEAANGIIHVNHLRPLSSIREEYVVDPIRDLRPVCPNYHAVLHRRNPAYSIEDVQKFLVRR